MERMPGIDVTAVIPAYNVASAIGAVLGAIPPAVTRVIVVDDGSTDETASAVERAAAGDPRIHFIRHERNGGVGAAMVTGFREALERRADIIVKIDGDGQMPLAFLPHLLEPLVDGRADYVKGNRFRDFQAIRKMPPLRRLGNMILSFLAKAATGYWNCFDPANGFVAIRADVLSQLPLQRIDPTYFFEISMLSHLYLAGAVVREQPMPARYEGEPSSLSIPRVVLSFPGRLAASVVRRMILKNFVYDFTVLSLQLAVGLPLLLAGLAYGGYHWYWYAVHRIAAPTGTVVLSALLIIIGFQLLLAAMTLDLQSIPRRPINRGALMEERGSEVALDEPG
jgi:glycosyltransferase involved in cell wall biosynthesis